MSPTMLRVSLIVSFAVASALMSGAADAGTLGALSASSMTSSSGSSSAFAQDSTYSTGFGMQAGEENVATSGSMRDANGNLVMQNGMLPTPSMSSLPGSNQSGVGNSNGMNATAIGNQLNVVVVGSFNTVVVNSKQVNNGNQTATTSLNGQLHF